MRCVYSQRSRIWLVLRMRLLLLLVVLWLMRLSSVVAMRCGKALPGWMLYFSMAEDTLFGVLFWLRYIVDIWIGIVA